MMCTKEINIDKLTLFAGGKIPIVELGLIMTQPTLKEVGIIGEKDFYASAFMLCRSLKDNMDFSKMNEEEKDYWESKTDLEVLTMATGTDPVLQIKATIFYSLLFPNYTVSFESNAIVFQEGESDKIVIDAEKFEILCKYIEAVLKLNAKSGIEQESFNPEGMRAKEIAEKIKANRKKVAEKNSDESGSGSLSSYISAFSIGTQTPLNEVLKYTVYQFQELLERFNLYTLHNMNIQAKMAGAKDVEDVNWYKTI